MYSLGLYLLVLALTPAASGAAEKPLLIVVEAAPGLGVDGAEVRQTIGTELGTPVLAPRDAEAGAPSALMIVALDRGDIRMSLREGKATPVSRTIPMPTERTARLQAIAWLAGNLARDQVSAIVGQTGVTPAPATPGAGTPPATEPPPLTASVTPPRPTAIETLSSGPAARPAAHAPSLWAVTVAGGPTATFVHDFTSSPVAGPQDTVYYGAAYQVEVQRQTPGAFLYGVALDAGAGGQNPDRPQNVLGAAAFVGSGWYRRRWFTEVAAGFGLEAIRTMVFTRVTSEGPYGSSDATTASHGLEPALYGRATATAGVPITPSFDLVARVGLHVTSSGKPLVSAHNQLTDYASLTVGVRLRLP